MGEIRSLAMTRDRRLANHALKCPKFRLKGGRKLATDRKAVNALRREPESVAEVPAEVLEVDCEGEMPRERIGLLRCAERKELREFGAGRLAEAVK